MPKLVYNILQFDGGINNGSDPRDILDNQLASIENMAVDEGGKLKVLGDVTTQHLAITHSGIATPGGSGFAAIKTDYDKFSVGPDANSGAVTSDPTKKVYYLIQNSGAIKIEDAAASETQTSITASGLLQAAIYYANGAVRIYDTDKDAPISPIWRGFIKGQLYGTDSTGSDTGITGERKKGHIYNSGKSSIDQWYTESAQIKPCFPEVDVYFDNEGFFPVGTNLIMANFRDCGFYDNSDSSGDATISVNDYEKTSVWAFANEKTALGAGPGATPPGAFDTNSNMFWGHGLGYQEHTGGNWAPTGIEKYKFFCTTVYDGFNGEIGKQESLPQSFAMYPSGPQAAELGGADAPEYGPASDNREENSYIKSSPVSAILFRDPTDSASSGTYATTDKASDPGTNLAIRFDPHIKWCGADYTHSGLITDNTFGASDNEDLFYNFGATNDSDRSGGNPRITGIVVYWACSDDGYTELYELYEWDFAKGVRVVAGVGGSDGGFTRHDWTGWGSATYDGVGNDHWYHHIHGGGGSSVDTGSAGFWSTSPPTTFKYSDKYSHTNFESLHVEGFSTSVLAGNRTWIGNVKVDGVAYRDKLICSEAGQHDKFPVDTNSNTQSVNDGDEIIYLAEYADRLLEFKEDVVYVHNITDAPLIIPEAKYKYKGVTNPGAVCVTDFGCAWANAHGAYIYDGEKVINLLEEEGVSKIKKLTWSTHIGTANYHRVGFNPTDRQIIVTAGADDSSAAYLFDMDTKSWTYSTAMITDVNAGSNFINNPGDGKLLIVNQAVPEIDTWATTASGSRVIVIKTKDIDFGEPSVRKKVYKVYVSYRGDGSGVSVNYAINGDNDLNPLGQFFVIGATGATTNAGAADLCLYGSSVGVDDWVKAELKPSAAINNINSIQLVFGGTAAANFEINDISIVYRMKHIK